MDVNRQMHIHIHSDTRQGVISTWSYKGTTEQRPSWGFHPAASAAESSRGRSNDLKDIILDGIHVRKPKLHLKCSLGFVFLSVEGYRESLLARFRISML